MTDPRPTNPAGRAAHAGTGSRDGGARDTADRDGEVALTHPPSGHRYLYAWLALLVLTLVSFGIDRLHLGSVSTAIALGVALIKASIVFVIFMHLDREPFAIRFVAALNVAWVLLLCLGIAADVGIGTRLH